MLERFVLPIHSLKRDRQVVIYVPDHYEDSLERYPVLYIQDGENAFSMKQPLDTRAGAFWIM